MLYYGGRELEDVLKCRNTSWERFVNRDKENLCSSLFFLIRHLCSSLLAVFDFVDSLFSQDGGDFSVGWLFSFLFWSLSESVLFLLTIYTVIWGSI